MKKYKGVYLAARIDRHPDYDIVYNDIDNCFGCDLVCDMLNVDLSNFDFVIATPPCNYWSRANPYYKNSFYSLNTKHLLPDILKKLGSLGKPFIVENVRNFKRFKENCIFDICDLYSINVYFIGRHTYFTNIFINLTCKQEYDFFNHGIRRHKNTQGGNNVHNVIEIWLKYIHEEFKKKDIIRS